MAQISKSSNTFLKALAKNNNREWFAEHKSEFKEYLKEYRLRFKRMSLNDHAGFIKYCNSLIRNTQ